MVCKCEIEKRLGGAWRGEGVSGCHVWRMKTQKLKESQHTSALASRACGPLHDTKGDTPAGQLALDDTDVHRHQEERSGGATWAAEELGQMADVCDDFKMMNRKKHPLGCAITNNSPPPPSCSSASVAAAACWEARLCVAALAAWPIA